MDTFCVETMDKTQLIKIDFENFLMEKHAEQYIGTKHTMVDDFNDWVTDLDVEELIECGNKYAKAISEHYRSLIPEKKDKPKPTIAELEKILDSSEEGKVYLKPDGSLVAGEAEDVYLGGNIDGFNECRDIILERLK